MIVNSSYSTISCDLDENSKKVTLENLCNYDSTAEKVFQTEFLNVFQVNYLNILKYIKYEDKFFFD